LQLSSSLGAGVLGVGIGDLLAARLGGLGDAILLVGLVHHTWGMTDKHALERRAGEVRPACSTAL